jgi:hypothetical protein
MQGLDRDYRLLPKQEKASWRKFQVAIHCMPGVLEKDRPLPQAVNVCPILCVTGNNIINNNFYNLNKNSF